MPMLNDRNRFSLTGAQIIRRRNNNQLTGTTEDIGEWNILPLVVEVNIFESIFDAAVSGSVAIADTASLSSIINFQGQEVIRLQWVVNDKQYDKEFYIWSVSAQNKSANTTTSTLVLEFVERHGYISEFTFLNGATAGNVSDIISDIMLSSLGVSLDRWVNAHQRMRIMHNNRTPLEIVKWLSRRATNSLGEPMFCFAKVNRLDTLNPESTDIRFLDLSTMLQTYEWSDEDVFRYSLTPNNDDDFRIDGVSFPENDNVFELASRGALKSTYFHIDPTTRNVESVSFDAIRHFDDRAANGSVSSPNAAPIFDRRFAPDPNNETIPIAERDSLFVSGINTTGRFDDGYMGFTEEQFTEHHRFKMSRESDWAMIEKQRFTISVPGYHFMAGSEDRGPGTMINIMIPKDQPSHTPNDNTVDAKRSGRFMIINQRHIMNAVTGDYTVVMDIGRPDTPDDVNDERRYNTQREQRPR